jgi:hypothetical protein
MTGRARFVLALVAFLAWIGVLALTVAKNGRFPVLSRAQLAAAKSLVVAEVTIDAQGLPVEAVTVTATVAGTPVTGTVRIANLPTALAAGSYKSPVAGAYLIPIVPAADGAFRIAGLPPSPGVNVPQPTRPTIYPWVDEVRAQLATLGLP